MDFETTSLDMTQNGYSYTDIMESLSPAVVATYYIVILAVAIISIIALWKIYVKAGEHGWASLIPFYSQFVEARIVWGNGWFFLIMFIPFANIIYLIATQFKLAKVFGKGVGFGFGLWLLPIIFMPILGFGQAQYIGTEKK